MEADTIVLIVTIVGSIVGSTLTTIILLLGQVNRLDGRLDVMGRDVADMGGRLGRIEGHLMALEGFRGRDLRPSASVEASPEDPVN